MDAIILAGGKGTRLRPFTDDRPKAMVEAKGVPILVHQLRWLKSQGVRDAIIVAGYKFPVILDYFGVGFVAGNPERAPEFPWEDMRLKFLIEKEPQGRGGAIKWAGGAATGFPVLAMNGDNVTDLWLPHLLISHRESGLWATVMVSQMVSPYGVVDVEGGKVTGFREKPRLPFWINAGIYVLGEQVWDYLPDKGDIEDSTFPTLAVKGQLHAYEHRGFWQTVDTSADLESLERVLP